jgi:hypothetical protein
LGELREARDERELSEANSLAKGNGLDDGRMAELETQLLTDTNIESALTLLEEISKMTMTLIIKKLSS